MPVCACICVGVYTGQKLIFDSRGESGGQTERETRSDELCKDKVPPRMLNIPENKKKYVSGLRGWVGQSRWVLWESTQLVFLQNKIISKP